VEILIQRIHQNAAKPQDLMALYNWTTLHLISDLTFGEPFDCLQHQRYHPWVTTFLENINGGVAVSAAERYGLGSLSCRSHTEVYEGNFRFDIRAHQRQNRTTIGTWY